MADIDTIIAEAIGEQASDPGAQAIVVRGEMGKGWA